MVAMLIDSEWDDRHNRAIERNLKGARFRYKASIEQLDYSTERGWTRTCCTASQMVSSLANQGECTDHRQYRNGRKASLLQPSDTAGLPVRLQRCFMPMLPGCSHN
ncbi:MAG: hypothetical protein H6551_06005 [Chitinophagales bacterium]|nr:hypothetical protein [Chitinophagales bacterium]